MREVKMLLGVLVAGLLLAAPGCQGRPSGDLDNLEDADGDGYGDVTPPESISFDDATNIRASLSNEVDQQDLAMLAEQYGVDPALLNLATVTARLTITLDYGRGISDVLTHAEEVAPFEKNFEVACPDSLTVGVQVTASAPVVGTQTLVELEDIVLIEGVDFECGQTVDVITFVDENGSLQATLEIS